MIKLYGVFKDGELRDYGFPIRLDKDFVDFFLRGGRSLGNVRRVKELDEEKYKECYDEYRDFIIKEGGLDIVTNTIKSLNEQIDNYYILNTQVKELIDNEK